MKISKTVLAISATTLIGCVGIVAFAGSPAVNNVNYERVNGIKVYSMQFNSTKNSIDNNETSISAATEKNNLIQFDYSGVTDLDGKWATFAAGGYFGNPKLETTYANAITGLSQIKVVYESEGDLTISYGWLSGVNYEFQNQPLKNNTPFYFGDHTPNYFKITNNNAESIQVTSLTLNYSCTADVDPGAGAYTITADYDNGTVISISTNEDGDYELPVPYREGYAFDGWIDSNEDAFAASGTIDSDVSIKATWTLDGTDTLAKLVKRAGAGVDLINITADFEIDETVTVKGDVTIYCTANRTLTRKSTFAGLLFSISSASTLTFGHNDYNGVLTIDGNKENVTASSSTRFLMINSGRTVNLYKNVILQNNKIDGNNGPVYVKGGTLNINGAQFINNESSNNGGAIFASSDAGSTVNINETNPGDIVFDGNVAGNNGGAIYCATGVTLNIDGASFENNSTTASEYGGGAIYLGASTTANIESATFDGNSSSAAGGAIYAAGTDETNLISVTFENNTSVGSGGAIHLSGSSTMNISGDSSFTSNTTSGAKTNGGAIYATGSCSLTVTGTVGHLVSFDSNTAVTNAGALYLYKVTGAVTFAYASFTGNQASAGGMAYIHTATASFTNCTFGTSGHGNRATNGGGVFLMAAKAHLNLDTCTITDNYGNYGGFLAFYTTDTGASSLTLKNIVASNNTSGNANRHFISCRASSVITIYTDPSQIHYNGNQLTTDEEVANIMKRYSDSNTTPTISPIPAE